MPTVTPINGWPIPEDTDLVKDGAEAIRDLGNAIDATAFGGLVHIKSETGTTVSGVNIDNVFTSNFLNYKIFFSFTTTNNTTPAFRLRAGGTPNTSANYQSVVIFTTPVASARESNQTAWNFNGSNTTNGLHIAEMTLYSPQVNGQTGGFYNAGISVNDATNVYTGLRGFGHNATFQADGIQITVPAGTLTARVRVYGLKD